MKNKVNIFLFLIFIIGYYCIISQIVLTRELFVVFSGNELSIGLIFGNWFIGIVTGAAFAGLCIKRINNYRGFFFSVILMSILLPLQVLCIRLLKFILKIPVGEFIPFLPMALSSFFIIFPLTFFIGFLFPFGCNIFSELKEDENNKAVKIGGIYGIEALGSLMGGLIFSFILVNIMSTFSVIFLSAFILLLSSFLFSIKHREAFLKYLFGVLLIINIIFIFQSQRINDFSIIKRWQSFSGINFLESIDSKYQNLSLGEQAGQYSLYVNGEYLSSFPDEYNYSMIGNFIMCEHPCPKKILLIGEGPQGLLRTLLLHRPDKIDYVLLDPEIISLLEKYLPPEDRLALKDPGVNLYYSDGRYFVKNASSSYDMIISILPEPHTAMVNRFYTVDFFEEVKRKLSKGGVFVFTLSSSENYIGKDTGNYAGSIYKSLKSVFPEVIVTPGDKNYFFASLIRESITTDISELGKRFEERNIKTDYFSPYHFELLLPPDRLSFIKKSLEKQSPSLNTDLRPISYFFNLIMWDKSSGGKFNRIFNMFNFSGFVWLIYSLLALFFLRISYIFCRPDERGEIRFNTLSSIIITGFSGMAMEIILIFTFQNIYGYIYQKIGLIVAIFMAGLGGGTFIMNKIILKSRKYRDFLPLITCGLWILFSISLPGLIKLSYSIYSEYIFYLWIIIAGILTGIVFPLSGKLYLEVEEDMGKVAGIIDSADHIGALMGSFLTGIFLIPFFGIAGTCSIIALLNGLIFILWGIYFFREVKMKNA